MVETIYFDSSNITLPSELNQLNNVSFACNNCSISLKNFNFTDVNFTPTTTNMLVDGDFVVLHSTVDITDSNLTINGNFNMSGISELRFNISLSSQSTVVIKNCSDLTGQLTLHIDDDALTELKNKGNLTTKLMDTGCVTNKFTSVVVQTPSSTNDCDSNSIDPLVQYGISSLSVVFTYNNYCETFAATSTSQIGVQTTSTTSGLITTGSSGGKTGHANGNKQMIFEVLFLFLSVGLFV